LDVYNVILASDVSAERASGGAGSFAAVLLADKRYVAPAANSVVW